MARRRRPAAVTTAIIHLLVHVSLFFSVVTAATFADDAAALQDLRDAIGGESLGWTGKDPCSWPHVVCDGNRVTSIQVANAGISGTLPPSISKLSKLTTLGLQNNRLTGPVPSLTGLTFLQNLYLDNNNFSSIPSGAFSGLTNLQTVRLDYNQFSPWPVPTELAQSTSLKSFTASKANAVGTIPDFFGRLPNLQELKLSYNNLSGGIPSSFAKSGIQILWLNNQQGEKLSGSISVLGQMPELTQVWLQTNAFSGPIPDLSKSVSLSDLQLRDNALTGVVPKSLTSQSSLLKVSLGNNQLQGPFPSFPTSVTTVDIGDTNSFCLPEPGPCDPRVDALLAIAADVNYPTAFADAWKGNDPCNRWAFVTCDSQGAITVLNFANQHLVGTISPAIANLTGLKALFLNNNNLTGTIPAALTMLPNLQTIDVSNNNLTGNVPSFAEKVALNITGNSLLGSSIASGGSGRSASAGGDSGDDASGSSISSAKGGSSSSSTRIGVGLGVSVALLLLSGLAYSYYRKTKCSKFEQVKSPHDSSNGTNHVKINIVNGNGYVMADQQSPESSGTASLADPGTMVISIQVLQQVTNNFCESNVIGRGGFGVVYRGELHDGTKIAVKRMEGAAAGNQGMNEFLAEIAVLTKVRHRHLVALLGYCIEGSERLLVYEYMPQGTLGQHLFEGPEKGFSFLNWKARLTIALDVARGVEYLHSLAQKSFIHRDLKPSNILLDDNMRAKVSDFGLVKLAPEGKCSLETRLAGTFGYLAPEYATTGRVTTKVDVFAFGVVLMEMITGRKALDESQPEESCHLVTWFRRILISNKGDIGKAIDPAINVDDEETFRSICTVAELAGHCTVREPSQRPDIGHAVNVLSPLVEQWKPCHRDEECSEGINYDIPLSVALQRWQANEGNSMMTDTFFRDSTVVENTQSSIPLSAACFPDAANCR
ncbi:Receptor protein kinase [Nymphaea thermarum]|nr:Receptor protein kinase [Nymphaea thermarum]